MFSFCCIFFLRNNRFSWQLFNYMLPLCTVKNNMSVFAYVSLNTTLDK